MVRPACSPSRGQHLAQLVLKSPAGGSVGFCRGGESGEWTCKYAAERLHGANGLTRSGDTFFVANCLFPQIHVLERQADDSLALTDVVATGTSCTGLGARVTNRS
jgi:hypothetical protein